MTHRTLSNCRPLCPHCHSIKIRAKDNGMVRCYGCGKECEIGEVVRNYVPTLKNLATVTTQLNTNAEAS